MRSITGMAEGRLVSGGSLARDLAFVLMGQVVPSTDWNRLFQPLFEKPLRSLCFLL
jgi:hypothetical protein